MCTCLQHWLCERARLLRSVEPQSQPLLWVQVCEETYAWVCVCNIALFFRLGLGATACSSSSGLCFSCVSSCHFTYLWITAQYDARFYFNFYFWFISPLLFRYAVQQSQSLWPALSWPSTGLHFVDVLLCVKRRCASPPLDVSLVSYFIP